MDLKDSDNIFINNNKITTKSPTFIGGLELRKKVSHTAQQTTFW